MKNSRKLGWLLLLVLSGCSGSGKPDNNTIVMAWDAPPRNYDPRYAIDATSQYLSDVINCSLFAPNAAGQIGKSLAAYYKWETPRKLVVNLRPEVVFSDGSPVTSEDVKATYDFLINPALKNPSTRMAEYSKIEKIETSGPKTVIFLLKEPDAVLITNLVIGILPAKFASYDGPVGDKSPPGCGPFVLKKSDLSSVELEKNPNYKISPQSPRISKVLIKIVHDESTRYAKLLKGELDLAQGLLNFDKLETIQKGNSGLKVLRRTGLNTTYIGFNMKDPITGNQKVREAIDLAIDRTPIIEHILKGYAKPAATMLMPTDPYLNPKIKPTQFNPEKAKKILDAAGFKDPDGDGPLPRLKITYKTTTNPTRLMIANSIASQLKSIGIQLEIHSLEWGKFKSDVDKGEVQMWSLSWIGFKDPDIFRYLFSTVSFPPNGANRGWFSNKELDKWLDKGKTTSSFDERKAAYFKVQEIIAKELPFVFLWHEDIYAVVNQAVQDFELYADGSMNALEKAYKK